MRLYQTYTRYVAEEYGSMIPELGAISDLHMSDDGMYSPILQYIVVSVGAFDKMGMQPIKKV